MNFECIVLFTTLFNVVEVLSNPVPLGEIRVFKRSSSEKAVRGRILNPDKRKPKDPSEHLRKTYNDLDVGSFDDKMSFRAGGKEPSIDLWENGVVYYNLDSSLSEEAKTAFKECVEDLETYTCIRFQRKTRASKNYVTVYTGADYACSSELGKYGGEQKTSLGQGCEYKGIVCHEMLHVLGFNHEQNRNDRNYYVTIKWENILSGAQANFQKFSPSLALTGGQPYDYNSILHYGKNAFAKDLSANTITTADPWAQDDIGQREGLSEYDVEKVNAVYQCPSNIDRRPIRRPRHLQLANGNDKNSKRASA